MKMMMRVLLIASFLITVVGGVASPFYAQTPAPNRVLIKSGGGSFVYPGQGKNNWRSFEIDLTDYESGILVVEVIEGGGKCRGTFCIFANASDMWPEGHVPRLTAATDVPAGGKPILRVQFSKPTKLIFGASGAWFNEKNSSNSYTFKAFVENGKKVSTARKYPSIPPVPTPCNDREVQVNYDKKSPKYHHYGPLETQLCLTKNPNCNLSSVFSTMISMVKYVTPVFSSSPVKNCMEIDANPNPLESDLVRIVVNTDKFSITNYTRRKHQFYPGEVRRTIVEKRGAIYVITEGEGTGENKEKNKAIAPALWQQLVDIRLKDGVKRMLLKQRSQ